MKTEGFVLTEIARQLGRIADALEENNNMIIDLGGHHGK